ncbi:hypothetical protein CK203_068002 [Vitis vinifera]|uniref:Uncharacterized protein n=1 Tax=Vitis vinifera TaxID=29760 RepID=A0A438EW51_VITVI|nr:hypothetical protein CK203_068002 [Vitis vinifera]
MLIETFHPPGDLYQHHSHLISMQLFSSIQLVDQYGRWEGSFTWEKAEHGSRTMGRSWWIELGRWDYSGVREITIVYDGCIDSIRVVYDKMASRFWRQTWRQWSDQTSKVEAG